MGSVKALTTTGDNDPELFPEEYYRHYMYCDWCGSFTMEPWVVPENPHQFTKMQAAVSILRVVSLISIIASALIVIYSVMSGSVSTGKFQIATQENTPCRMCRDL